MHFSLLPSVVCWALDGKGIKSRLDKALFADLSATIVGSFFGTSKTTTYVESSAGIAVGG